MHHVQLLATYYLNKLQKLISNWKHRLLLLTLLLDIVAYYWQLVFLQFI